MRKRFPSFDFITIPTTQTPLTVYVRAIFRLPPVSDGLSQKERRKHCKAVTASTLNKDSKATLLLPLVRADGQQFAVDIPTGD